MTGTVLKTSSSKVRVRRRHALAAGGSCSFKMRSTPGAPSRVCCSFSSCRASAVPFTSMTCEKRSPVSAARLLAGEQAARFLSRPKRRSSHLVRTFFQELHNCLPCRGLALYHQHAQTLRADIWGHGGRCLRHLAPIHKAFNRLGRKQVAPCPKLRYCGSKDPGSRLQSGRKYPGSGFLE